MTINFNGNLYPAGQALFPSTNRAFRYGDGLFESIRVFEGRLPFLHRHWQRLSEGMRGLKMDVPPHYSPAFFEKEIAKLTTGQGNWRLRLSVFRSGAGLYLPEQHEPQFLVEGAPWPQADFELNQAGWRLGLLPTAHLPVTAALGKTANALPYVMAAISRQEKDWDECLLLNPWGRIASGGSANVFIQKNRKLATPPLLEGCIPGTMRAIVLDWARQNGTLVVEKRIRPQDLASADAVFLTNAVQGIRWAAEVEGVGRAYGPGMAPQIVAALNALARPETGA